jgi:uncharacterized secreted protein with C-terminal beta-propeller domain
MNDSQSTTYKDRANPKEALRIAQDGWYVSSRLYNNTLYMITNKGANLRPVPSSGPAGRRHNGEAKLLATDSINIRRDG